jgi:predicted double-glycine peptidase
MVAAVLRDEGGPAMRLLLAAACSLLLIHAAAAASDGVAHPPSPVRSLLELRQQDVVVQRWDLSCGAAALATILTYEYGDPVSEKDVARQMLSRTGTLQKVQRRGGFSLLDLKRFAESHGYEATGYAGLSLAQLVEHAPAIVPLHAISANHFVVFRGLVERDRVALSDPAWGNRTMPTAEFESAWDHRIGFVIEGRRPLNRLRVRPADWLLPRDAVR